MISSIFSFEIINCAVPDPRIFFRLTASVGDAATVNRNIIKTLLAIGVSKFFIDDKIASMNVLTKLRNAPS